MTAPDAVGASLAERKDAMEREPAAGILLVTSSNSSAETGRQVVHGNAERFSFHFILFIFDGTRCGCVSRLAVLLLLFACLLDERESA